MNRKSFRFAWYALLLAMIFGAISGKPHFQAAAFAVSVIVGLSLCVAVAVVLHRSRRQA